MLLFQFYRNNIHQPNLHFIYLLLKINNFVGEIPIIFFILNLNRDNDEYS